MVVQDNLVEAKELSINKGGLCATMVKMAEDYENRIKDLESEVVIIKERIKLLEDTK